MIAPRCCGTFMELKTSLNEEKVFSQSYYRLFFQCIHCGKVIKKFMEVDE